MASATMPIDRNACLAAGGPSAHGACVQTSTSLIGWQFLSSAARKGYMDAANESVRAVVALGCACGFANSFKYVCIHALGPCRWSLVLSKLLGKGAGVGARSGASCTPREACDDRCSLLRDAPVPGLASTPTALPAAGRPPGLTSVLAVTGPSSRLLTSSGITTSVAESRPRAMGSSAVVPATASPPPSKATDADGSGAGHPHHHGHHFMKMHTVRKQGL